MQRKLIFAIQKSVSESLTPSQPLIGFVHTLSSDPYTHEYPDTLAQAVVDRLYATWRTKDIRS